LRFDTGQGVQTAIATLCLDDLANETVEEKSASSACILLQDQRQLRLAILRHL